MRFARAILTRPATFSIVFIAANIFLFLLMWERSGLSASSLWVFPEPVLLAFGAKLNSLIKDRHQWWRFVTPVFIHVGLFHLLINMYGLWQLGPLVERLYGSAKFVVFWVLTGVAGVAASYLTVQPDMRVNALGSFLFKAQDMPSAGASGALFGLVGVLFVFGIKFRHELPESFKRAFGTGMLPVILINFAIGYAGRGFIDNAAHVGGLVSGAALALLVRYRRPGERASIAICWHVLQVAALALVAVSFLMVARHFNDPIPDLISMTSQFPVTGNNAVDFINALNSGQQVLVKTINERDASGVDKAVEALNRAPRLDDNSDALRNEMKDLLARAKEYATMPTPDGRAKRRAQEQQRRLIADHNAWSAKLKQWVETDGAKYSIELQENPPPSPNSADQK